ncbi:NAD+ synthase [candidate division GN15 bacterium]|uniref:Glutamine-dependent NAD(+) synthetase n=1 Tax=candidate division GN15 bacterium TaxID=2072418 RepID=A0A855X956_9BACT|nr:MAG: NAD+ synthase [candidate division GN15 bacterium]
MKIALAQLNPTVGDISGNIARIAEVAAQHQRNVDLIVFTELFVVGYPPRDLLAEPWFIRESSKAIDQVRQLSAKFPSAGILFGAPVATHSETGLGLHNSAILVNRGEIVFTQHKSLLPTYDVFYEGRYFDPAESVSIVRFKDTTLGISICEDFWNDPELWPQRIYATDPIESLALQGAQLMINISASPFALGKEQLRYRLIRNHARKHRVPFIFVNQVGANDELIFDGRSMVFDPDGRLTHLLPEFEEAVTVIDTNWYKPADHQLVCEECEDLYRALTLGIRDYLRKCGFSKAVIGLSGGIDSAVVGALAAAAIGPENVLGITMPSPYSADESTMLAQQLAENLGIEFRIIPITPLYDAYTRYLGPQLGMRPGEINVAFENVQARIRGNILMSFSNQTNAIVLSTGNKSEMATGYCTLYGDMAGGLAAISDVPKTLVFELARYINRTREVIPIRTIERPPSAELRPNQVDRDSLPPYDILDRILHHYIEERMSIDQMVKVGLDRETVKWVVRAVDYNEYKRRQSAPGLKVTSRAFGIGRRMPVAAKYNHGDD